MGWVDRKSPEVWKILLNNHPMKWLKILHQYNIDPEHDDNPDTDDDPIPEAVINVLKKSNFNTLYIAIQDIPRRKTKHFDKHIIQARRILNEELRNVWSDCLKHLKIKLPLLILDEAHHLKNEKTILASLFQNEEAKADGEELDKGVLAGVFERMLFLTATPFQLGHHELCSVLDRFTGIDWFGRNAPQKGFVFYTKELQALREKLDIAQESAVRLDKLWANLKPEDFVAEDSTDLSVSWWENFNNRLEQENHIFSQIYNAYSHVRKKMGEANQLLRKYVIRHSKAKELPGEFFKIKRRNRVVGRNILNTSENFGSDESGLAVMGDSLLPFLLAARMTVKDFQSRPIFAEGLSSSFEAYLYTRSIKEINSALDNDDVISEIYQNDENEWYLQYINKALPKLKKGDDKISHPKVAATVKKVMDLWLNGEKVLVFCHYIATGKAMRQYISHSMNQIIIKEGTKRLNCKNHEVLDRLDNLGERFAKRDSEFMQTFQKEVFTIINRFPTIKKRKEDLFDLIRRYIRTPSFLVRFFPLDETRFSERTLLKALERKDGSGLTLRQLIIEFFEFLQKKCGEEEREQYISSLLDLQTGSIRGTDMTKAYTEDELQGDDAELLVPNVRLVNGTTRQNTRQKLMLTFNTPFYPDVLVASSVLAEGVDLHLNCRHIIHHDLCWNPSTLEQRTGRVDRIGAKAEKCGQPIFVYMPYISETQDEKMYRVVMDRERWFKVVMGENYKVDTKATDKISERIPLPEYLAEQLAFKLEV